MLKKAAWLALKIEVVLFLILVAGVALTGFLIRPGPDSESSLVVYVPLLFQFAALWLLSPDIYLPMLLLAPVMFVVQYLAYAAIVFIILWLRAIRSVSMILRHLPGEFSE